MKVNVLMNGVEVMAEIANENFVEDIKVETKGEVFRDIVAEMIDYNYMHNFAEEDELTENEIEEIYMATIENVPYDEIITRLGNGVLMARVHGAYQGIIDNRVKYFRVRVNYSGSFDVMIKAKSEEEAIDYINDGDCDLEDYIDGYYTEYDVDDVIDEYDEEPNWDREIIEAE